MFPTYFGDEKVKENLFDGMRYFDTGAVDDEVIDLLKKGGAKRSTYLSGITTLCIAGEDPDDDVISEAKDILDVPSVDQEWVYGSTYCKAQLPLNGFCCDSSRIFSGIILCLGNLEEADSKKIWAMVTWYGGKVTKSVTPDVTHLVTTSPEGEEYQAALGRSEIEIVTPDWVVESIKENCILQEEFFHLSDLKFVESSPICDPSPPSNCTEKQTTNRESKGVKSIPSKSEILKEFMQKQHEVIQSHLRSLDNEERSAFLALSTSEQRLYVARSGLVLELRGENICLTKEQEHLLQIGDTSDVSSKCKQVESSLTRKEEKHEQVLKDKTEHSSEGSEEVVEEVEPSCNLSALLSSKPPRQKIQLTLEQKKQMLKMGRQQRCLYLKNIEKETIDSDNKLENVNKTEGDNERRGILNNISNLTSRVLQKESCRKIPSPIVKIGNVPSLRIKIENIPSPRVKKVNIPTPRVKIAKPILKPAECKSQIEKRASVDICLLGCTFLIVECQDLEAKDIVGWENVIRKFGGELATNLNERVTHVMAHSQSSEIVRSALAQGKRIVTEYWLSDVIRKKKLLPPWKAIHFPIPSGFKSQHSKMSLTVTGFESHDRDYVKLMINIIGATYTSFFTKENHAIVCKEEKGEKYVKAKEWNIPVVSVEWLNDVMFGSEDVIACLESSKYKTFDTKDPLKIDSRLVQNLLDPWKTDIKVSKEMFNDFKMSSAVKNKRKLENPQNRSSETKRIKLQCCLQESLDVCLKTSVAKKVAVKSDVVLSNKTSPELGPEKIAEKAPDSLQASDIFAPVIMLSAIDKALSKDLNQTIQMLGGVVTESPRLPTYCTHLVMSKLCRTDKFLQCLPVVKYVVSSDWLVASGKAGRWVREEGFELEDLEMEEKFNFKLATTLAKKNRDKLFAGKTFFLTPNIKPDIEILTNIIVYGGGRVETINRKSVEEIKESNQAGNINYLVISCQEDLECVKDILIEKMAIYSTEFVLSAVMKCEMDFNLSSYIAIASDTPSTGKGDLFKKCFVSIQKVAISGVGESVTAGTDGRKEAGLKSVIQHIAANAEDIDGDKRRLKKANSRYSSDVFLLK